MKLITLRTVHLVNLPVYDNPNRRGNIVYSSDKANAQENKIKCAILV